MKRKSALTLIELLVVIAEPRVVCESGEDEAIRELVQAGLGLAIISSLAAKPAKKGLVRIPLVEPKVERTLGLISRRDHERSVAAKQFASLLSAEAHR